MRWWVAYMNCARCGLVIRLRVSWLTLEHCPRCVAKAGVVIPMYVSDGPSAWSLAQNPSPDRQVERDLKP
jgi:hypothetical protein